MFSKMLKTVAVSTSKSPLAKAGLFSQLNKTYSTVPRSGFYGKFIQGELSSISSIYEHIEGEKNKDRLRQLVNSVTDQKHLLEAFNSNDKARAKTLINSSLLENMKTNNTALANRSFSQKKFINSVNKWYERKEDKELLPSFGVCEELVWLWYGMDVVLNKDLFGKCDEISKKCDQMSKWGAQPGELPTDDKAFLELFAQLKKGGKRTLIFEDQKLSPNCSIEEHLMSCLPPSSTIDLLKPDSYKNNCEEFSKKTIEDLKQDGGLKFIRIAWQDSGSHNLVHVLGASYAEVDNQPCFRLFDPNSGSTIASSSIDAEKELTKLLDVSLEGIKKYWPKSKVFLSHSVTYNVHENPEYSHESTNTCRP